MAPGESGSRQNRRGNCSSPIRGLEDPSAPFPHPLAPPPPAPSSPARQPHAGRTARDCQRRSRSSSSSPGLLGKGGWGWFLRLATRGARLNSSRRQRSWPLQRGGKRASQLQPRPASPLFESQKTFFFLSLSPPPPLSSLFSKLKMRRMSRRLALSVLGILWIAALLLFLGARRKLEAAGPEGRQTPKVREGPAPPRLTSSVGSWRGIKGAKRDWVIPVRGQRGFNAGRERATDFGSERPSWFGYNKSASPNPRGDQTPARLLLGRSLGPPRSPPPWRLRSLGGGSLLAQIPIKKKAGFPAKFRFFFFFFSF